MRVGQSRKRDASEQAIVDALEAIGATVFRLSGPGVPDLLVGFKGHWTPMEVKARTGRLTPLQAKNRWGNTVPIVRSVDEAYQAVGVVRRALTRPYVLGEDA